MIKYLHVMKLIEVSSYHKHEHVYRVRVVHQRQIQDGRGLLSVWIFHTWTFHSRTYHVVRGQNAGG